MHSDTQMATEVILRECGGGRRGVGARAVRARSRAGRRRDRQRDPPPHAGLGPRHARGAARASAALEGPKSVILISEGLIFEGLGSETDELASIAADSRATLDILLLDVPQFDASQSSAADHAARGSQPAGHRASSSSPARRAASSIASTSRADFAFDRISRSLDGYYLLGVESRPDDRNGRRHRIGVKTHAARRVDPVAPQLPDVDVGEGDDAGRRGDARDPIAAADQRSAAEDVDVDLQGAGQRQGARAGRRRSRAARWTSRSITRSAWRS